MEVLANASKVGNARSTVRLILIDKRVIKLTQLRFEVVKTPPKIVQIEA
jgi:hypothetical protein